MQVDRVHLSSLIKPEHLSVRGGAFSHAEETCSQKNLFFNSAVQGKTVRVERGERIFLQGDAATSIFRIQHGTVKLAVLSNDGKKAIIALLSSGDFVGEECVMKIQPRRAATAFAVTPCTLVRIEKEVMERLLHEEKALFDEFLAYLLSRSLRLQDDLIDQLFNSNEKRLARELLLLARSRGQNTPRKTVPGITQEMLAEMIGTTRSQVNRILNKFRKLGFIEYRGRLQGIHINNTLLHVVQEN
jgi:CRP-like cAMP-binding protein